MNIIKLNSVGCGIDESLLTYAQNADGTYDWNTDHTVHISECTDEWIKSLSVEDIKIIFNLKTKL